MTTVELARFIDAAMAEWEAGPRSCGLAYFVAQKLAAYGLVEPCR